MPGTETSIVIQASPKTVFDVITDFEKYPEFLSDVKDVVVHKKGKEMEVTFEISVIKKIRYKLHFSLVPNKKVSWTFVEGDVFKDNNGFWELEEVKKGTTNARYYIDIEFGFLVPSMITKKLIGSNLPSMMKRFKERAESL